MHTTSTVALEGKGTYEKYLSLKDKGLILFECIVGSQAYGTSLPTSDIDRKFIYIDDLDSILSDKRTDQINITDDYVGYELGRYFDLLVKQSPNMHELAWSPEDCIEYCHPLFREIVIKQRDKFLSKQIRFSFGEYASSQIKKAKGLNKKINNPMEKERKTLLDFCFIPYNQGSIPVLDWLKMHDLKQEYCGLVAIDHMHYTYHLFYDEENKSGYKGIIQKDNSNDVSLSSVEKGAKSLTIMYFNVEGYTKYCKDYKDYWTWVEKRNEVRYQTNLSHGAEYDSKNMAHCHRLLDTCIEAFTDKVINVRRPNREQLLKIRNGEYRYDDLLMEAEEKIKIISTLYETTSLPNSIDTDFVKEIILDFRKSFYYLK